MNAALAIIAFFFVVAVALALLARRGHTMDLEQWSVGGRGFGAIFVFLLMAGEIYTTFTFLGGSGYAGLGSIANLAPDYIKLDISLISNIDSNFLKQNLVETLVSFAEGQGAMVIAEGVERREEFETVKELGVHLTHGFLFHRPKYAGKLPST